MSASPFDTAIAPWLSIGNCSAATAFYKEAFGAVEVYRLETPDGGLVVRLSVAGAEFWVSGSLTDPGIPEPAVGGDSIKMVITVNDPDILFARAIAAGATEIFPVGEAHGWRLGRLSDPFGLHWEIGRML